MADIELVIKVPECFYEYCKTQTDAIEIELAVAKGMPLPKGHGRLIDADCLLNQFPIWVDNISSATINVTILKAPTIIEADVAESEDVR